MLNDILLAKKSLFADDAVTVLRGQETRSRRVTFVKGNLVSNSRSESRGVNARVLRNGVYGFSAMAEYSDDAAVKVLKAANDNALFLAKHCQRNIKEFSKVPEIIVPVNREINDTKQKEIIDFCKELDDYINETYPDLTSRTITYYEDSMDKVIVSSDASSGHITSPRAYVYIILDSETKDGTPLELFKAFGGAGGFYDYFKSFEWMKEDIDKLYRQLMDKKEGVYAEAGMKTVILGADLAGMLSHEAVGHTVEADLVLGGSIAGKKLCREVASPLVTMTDYANTAFGELAPLPVYLDDEGIVAKDQPLIENGILTGYMNNRETAAGFNMEPKGNARGWSYGDEPLIRMRNTAITPGKDSLEDMIASVDDGYYLISTGNGQADLTGEFMFGISMGYEIKNGKLGRAILDTTVSGVAFEMLKTVDMVSSNMTWSSSGFCGKKQPMPVGMGGPEIRCKIMIGGR